MIVYPHRLLAVTSAILLGASLAAPAALAATGQGHPAVPVESPAADAPTGAGEPVNAPAYVPCPITAAATKVRVPRSTLPPVPPAEASAPAVGGPGLATSGLSVPPGAPPLPGNLAAHAWLVADLDTGEVLGACAPHQRYLPASVQKLLLSATVMPRLDPNQTVQVTAADLDFEQGSSAVGLVAGGHYTVATLWLGLLLVSGNDAADVLARLGGGPDGVAGTLRDMNELAYRLGARDTHAVTPHGLDAPGQYTTAYDLALIARVCFDRDDFRRYATTPTTQIPGQSPINPRGFQIQNDNLLISQYPGALGGKNGFTDAARHTYVGAAQRNGHRLVVTMLDAEAVPERAWQQGAALLNWGFAVAGRGSVGHLARPGELDPSPSPRDLPAGSRTLSASHSVSGGNAWLPVELVAATLGFLALVVAGLRRRAVVRSRRRRQTGIRGHRSTARGGPA